MEKPRKIIIDLFCGCGGFSLGAHLAGFNPVLGVDIDPILSSAYALNFPQSKLVHFDLAKTSGKEILKTSGHRKIFGITGGPPCQGFSMMGKRNTNDPRNELICHFFDQVKDIQPSFFVMENVPGLNSGVMRQKLEKQIKSISEDYTVVGPIMVTTSSLGAATKRQRIIVIGYNPSEFATFGEQDIMSLYSEEVPTVRDAIGDLPSPKNCDAGDFGWAKYDNRKRVSGYARRAREMPSQGCGWTTAIEKMQIGYVSGLMNTIHSREVEKRYGSLSPGSSDGKSKAYKLEWEGQCPTLRAGTGSDKGSYQAVRPIHPDHRRVITVREAARLQGFPDWFVFHPTKWHSFRMIGNSVSPYLAQTILDFIKKKVKAPKNIINAA